MTTYEKAKYRKTVEWQDFRDEFRIKHLDSLTEEPLKKKYTLHHTDLNPEHYKNLDEDFFMGFNSSYEHRLVHYIYTKFLKDPRILIKLEAIIKRMVEINHYKDIKDFK